MKYGKEKNGTVRVLVRLLLTVTVIALAAAAVGTAVLCISEERLKRKADPALGDAVIVLGAQVKNDGSVSLQLQKRLEKALEAYRIRKRPVVVCGGQGKNEPCTEAQAMKAWLIREGVPEQDILTDERSGNTYQNVRNALSLLEGKADSLLIVTSDYHLPRALAIAGEAGAEASGLPGETLSGFWLKNHSRELLAWGKYLFGLLTGADIYGTY